MKSHPLFLLLTLSLLTTALPCSATDDVNPPLPPLFKGLGRHHWKITTRYEMAQRYFDQGVTLLYNFNHAEAIRSFAAAAQLDPACPMAHWGVAYAYGPNINAPMFPDAVPKAWAALQAALALKAKGGPVEQALIDALARRYAPTPPADRAPLDLSYAGAMRVVAEKFSDHDEVITLFAEALMDTAPWRYWTPELQPKPATAESLAAIERILARTPAHPGANHLYIHLVEAGPHPEKGIPSAERLAHLTPQAGHLVHMPSHIFLRVGRYHDASEWNDDAIEVDENYLRRTRPTGVYPGGYYPHNLHFYWFSTTMEGRSRDAFRAATKLARYTLDLRCGAIEGPRQRYTPLLSLARFGRWSELLQSPAPAADLPFDRAMWHYARGLAHAAQGRADESRAELSQFTALETSNPVKAMDNPYFPGTHILAIAHAILAGKVAAALDTPAAAFSELRHAIALEDAMPYMEPPYWHHAARLSLGAAQLRARLPAAAERTFRDDLARHPLNGWALHGLEQSLRAQGLTATADDTARAFKHAWRYADVKPDLTWY